MLPQNTSGAIAGLVYGRHRHRIPLHRIARSLWVRSGALFRRSLVGNAFIGQAWRPALSASSATLRWPSTSPNSDPSPSPMSEARPRPSLILCMPTAIMGSLFPPPLSNATYAARIAARARSPRKQTGYRPGCRSNGTCDGDSATRTFWAASSPLESRSVLGGSGIWS